MKKIYLVAVTVLLTFSANAQEFEETFEGLSLGPLFNDLWTTFSGVNNGTENIVVDDSVAFEGALSGFIGGDTVQDAVLDFPGDAITSGVWSIQFKMRIPSGSTGYFNVQGDVDPTAGANLDFLSNNINFVDGTMRINPGADVDELADGSNTVTYIENLWTDVLFITDFDAGTYEIRLDGVSSGAVTIGSTNLGGIDFFSSADTNFYNVDNIRLVSGILGTDEFSGDVFSVYPNPVVNELNIKSASVIDNVTIYDVLGKQVLSVNPDAISPSVDMSALTSGAYLVNITIGNASKTVKVLK